MPRSAKADEQLEVFDKPEPAEEEVAQSTDTPSEPPPAELPQAEPEAKALSGDFPLADPGPYYIGLWAGHPNYKCPYCLEATLAGNGAIELHILDMIDRDDQRHMAALELKES